MTALEEFMQWCTKELARLRHQLEEFETGNMNLRHRSVGAPWVDQTSQEIARLKKNIGDLEAVLRRLKN